MSDVTYPEVGATTTGGELPAGYHRLRRSVRAGTGREAFERLAEGVMSWGIHRGAGLHLRVGPVRPAVGVRFVATIGVGPVGLRAPCEVVRVIEEPDRVGYAFGTLPGHAETGEECFVARHGGPDPSVPAGTPGDQDAVWFDLLAFVRPRAWYAKLGGPLADAMQEHVTGRYLRAARTLAG